MDSCFYRIYKINVMVWVEYIENSISFNMSLTDLKTIKDKYNDIINKSSGKVIKVEEWGLLGLANKIYNFKGSVKVYVL